jgi:hypothetical protein
MEDVKEEGVGDGEELPGKGFRRTCFSGMCDLGEVEVKQGRA